MNYINLRPIINGSLRELSDILIENGQIKAVVPHGSMHIDGAVTDLKGNIIAAGYIDIHTHGGMGHDFMEGTTDALKAISDYHLSTGTTTYCPTTLTADIAGTVHALETLRNFKDTTTARRLGAHLEGPYISMKAPGAHPPKYILNPNEENTRWVIENKDVVSRITVAPDNSGAPYLTALCVNNGIQVSLGHDASIDDEIYSAVEAGASSVTHMYNCTSRPSRRTTPDKHLGLTEVGLISDKLTAEVIADNRHVPNPLFSMIYKLKGADGIALVSDSLSVAGMKKGDYYLGSGDSKQKLRVDNGVATLPELNTYAGSITPISSMVINLHNNLGLPLEECVKMGTLTPAKVMRLRDRGDIESGMLADFNVLNPDGTIIATILNGELLNKD